MAKVNTNSFCRVSTVSSSFFPDTRETIVEVTDNKGRRYIGRAKWNKQDDFDPTEGFRIAYARALEKIPKDDIITKCGGLKDGDWVRIQNKNNDYVKWGIVFHNDILYMIGSGNYDRIDDFSNGETAYDRITTVVRGNIGSRPVTYDSIYLNMYPKSHNRENYTIYTAD